MKTINVKNHGKQRYCQRILGITDEIEWKRHIAQNDAEIVAHISHMVDQSSFIYRGQLGDNTTKVFRIYDKVVLVMDSQETCVITLFKCIFDFGEDMDRKIIANEIEIIGKLNEELKEIDLGIQAFVEQKDVEATTIAQQIKAMEAQIQQLRIQKEGIDAEVKSKKATREFSLKEVEKRAVRICNSIEYRKDLNANAS